MGKPYSAQRLANIRRMRKARRLYRLEPVFAYERLSREYAGYSQEDFLDDLRIRSKRKGRKKSKSPLMRYGRFRRMQKLIDLFMQTDDIAYALQAQRLRDNMTAPYRLQLIISGAHLAYSFSALIRIEDIESLVKRLSACKSQAQAERIVREFDGTSEMH